MASFLTGILHSFSHTPDVTLAYVSTGSYAKSQFLRNKLATVLVPLPEDSQNFPFCLN